MDKDEEIKEIIKELRIKEIELAKAAKVFRKNKSNNLNFGEIVEIDACDYKWMNGKNYHVYAAVDASTSYILALHMEKEETNEGHMKLIEDVLKTWGKPKHIFTDKRRTFWGTDHSDSPLKKALNSKGIELKSSSISIFKPHVERTNDSIQRFLPPHLHLNKIKTIEQFNANKKHLIDSFHKRNNKHYKHKKNVFEKIDVKNNEHKMFLAINRKIYASTVQFENNFYVAVDKVSKRRQYITINDNVDFVIDSDSNLKFIINDKEYDARILLKDEVSEFQKFVYIENWIKHKKKSNISTNELTLLEDLHWIWV